MELKICEKNKFDIHNAVSNIVFISDLHFDYTEGHYMLEQAQRKEDEFVNYVKQNYSSAILCVCGDFYSDYIKTMEFIEKMEREEIKGFFVLGNHDYWSAGLKSYDEVIEMFEEKTKRYKYFRLLISGKKYYIGDVCFIGDTGWTSFKRNGERVDLEYFDNLPEVKEVRNFSCIDIIERHNKWIEFANNIIPTEKKVIISSHFPMIDFTKKSKDCWWSSETKMNVADNYWNIFGHTHKDKQQENNCVSAQRGYKNKREFWIDCGEKQYEASDFGTLVKEELLFNKGTLRTVEGSLLQYYTVINAEKMSIQASKAVRRRGFRRCSANKEIIAMLATSPEKYLIKVKKKIKAYEKNIFIGYRLITKLNGKTLENIYEAIGILEQGLNRKSVINIREFVIAAVLTGYVYNDVPYLIEDESKFRSVDDFDIIRFYLMFLTIQKYGIKKTMIEFMEIRASTKRGFFVGNVEIKLPVINGKCLNVQEVLESMEEQNISNSIQMPVQIPDVKRKVNVTEQVKRIPYSDKKLRDLKADVYMFLVKGEGDISDIEMRLGELKKINEQKYYALESKYRGYDIRQKLFTD